MVPYYAQVTLRGTTPEPHQKVTIYFEAAGEKHFAARRRLTAGADGSFTFSYHAARTQSYYARVDGADSAVHRTRLVTADCVVSKPAFQPDRPWFPDQSAAFEATRIGKWGGVESDPHSRLSVITWRSGRQQPHELGHFGYAGAYNYDEN
jgi:hypothetical protein